MKNFFFFKGNEYYSSYPVYPESNWQSRYLVPNDNMSGQFNPNHHAIHNYNLTTNYSMKMEPTA